MKILFTIVLLFIASCQGPYLPFSKNLGSTTADTLPTLSMQKVDFISFTGRVTNAPIRSVSESTNWSSSPLNSDILLAYKHLYPFNSSYEGMYAGQMPNEFWASPGMPKDPITKAPNSMN